MFSYSRVSLVSGGVGWGESAATVPGYLSRVPVLPYLLLEISRRERLRWFSYWGWGFGLDRWRLPPLKVVVSTRLTPWEAGVRSGEGSDLQTELERRVESVRELAARERGETVRSSVSVGEEYHFPIRS